MVAIKFVAEDSNVALRGQHQAVDHLDVVFVVDECPMSLVVHQVVDFTSVALAGVEEDVLAVHHWAV